MPHIPARARRTLLQLAPLVVIATLVGIAASDTGGSGDRRTRARDRLSGGVAIDGSIALRPMTEAAASSFGAAHPGVRVTVGASGDTSAIDAFCAGELDIATVDRKLDPAEQHECFSSGTPYVSIELAREGMAVIVSDDNPFPRCLTLDQLGRIWAMHDPARTWADVSPELAAIDLRLVGSKPDSAAHLLFAQALFGGTEPKTRDDFEVAASSDELIQDVAGHPNALGYLPFGEYRPGLGVTLVGIHSGMGCVKPSTRAIRDGSYRPLSRPLYLDVSRRSLRRDQVRAFTHRYLRSSVRLARAAGVMPIADLHRVYRRFTRP